MADYLKKVDVVIELRDARIPVATTHPSVPKWVGNKPLIVAVTRLDQVSPIALQEWKAYYASNPAYAERPDAKVFFIDGQSGSGVPNLKTEALKAGVTVNAKRVKHGIQPRAVRAAVIGFPNVGKSALINRLLGRTRAKSRNKAGVTRQLTWVRLGGRDAASKKDQSGVIELLDSPGIIPAGQIDQAVAVKLAICNDIGEAAYDRAVVAAAMCELLKGLHRRRPDFVDMPAILERFGIPLDTLTGEETVNRLADAQYGGNALAAADRLLGDFRKGLLGFGSLECCDDAPVQERGAAAGPPVGVTAERRTETRPRQD